MASISRDVDLKRPAAEVWDIVRDVGRVHERMAKGFVVDCSLEPDGAARVVTFANGLVARELIVGIDEERRRLAYGIVDGRPSFYAGSFTLTDRGLVWHVDVLPDEMAPAIAAMMDEGVKAMHATIDGT